MTNEVTGFFNIYKEKGMTSHDVVARMRRILQMKKIGHAGTLDPNAEGVMLVGTGRATKFIQYLELLDKTYRAQLILGKETDTYDITGEIVATKNKDDITIAELKTVIKSFCGEQLQVPPIYSALKKNGRKLYEYARAGETIEISARPIIIHSIACEDEQNFPKYITLNINCSKGTYIRSLCHDIGQKLEISSCMGHLLRTSIGSYGVENAITLAELEQIVKSNQLDTIRISTEEATKHFDIVYVLPQGERFVRNGNALYSWNSCDDFNKYEIGQILRFHDEHGFIGLGKVALEGDMRLIKPIKLL